MTSPRQKKKKYFLKQLQEARRSQEEVEVTAAVETIVEQAEQVETPKIAVVSSLKTETVSKKVKPVKTIEQKSEEVKTDLSE